MRESDAVGRAAEEADDDASAASAPVRCLDRLRSLLSFLTTDRFLKFLSLFCAFLCMGLTLAVIGPSLLELGAQTGASLSGLVYIFSGRSLGFFTGTILGGDFVDRWKQHGFTILAASLAANVLLTFCVPLIPVLALLIGVCFLQGTALGIVDNLSQVLLIRLMDDGQGGKQVQPYMQALHAAFGVGAFFAPLIMSPFLGGEALYVDPLTQVDSGAGSGGVNGTAVVPQTTTIVQASGSTTYHYAYFLICLLNLPVVLSLGYYSLRDEITVAQVIALVKRACCGRWSRGSGGSWDRVGSGAEDSGSGAGYADEQNDLSHQHHHSGSASSEFGLASPSNLHGSGNGHSGVEMSIVLSHEGGDDDEAALELGSGQAHGDGGADAVFRPPEEDSPDAHHTATGRRDSSALLLANGGVGAMHVIMPHTHEANGHGHSSHDHHHLHVHDLASPGSGTTVSSSPPASAALMISASPTALSPEPSPSPSEDAADADSAAAAASSPRTFRENLSACCTALSDPKWKLVLLVSLFLFLYVGCESGYAAYIFSYGVQALGMAPASAAFLNATFWFAFAVGRLAAIPLSLRFSSTQLIFTDLAGCILCVLAMIIFHDSLALLWVGTILYGLSVASIYPSAINYAESQIEMSGRVLSLMTVSASLGDAIVPLLMGLSFESPTGPLGLMLIAAGVAVGAAVIFAIIVGCVAPAAGGKRGGQADEAEEARARKRRERSRKKRRAAAVAAVAAAQAAAAGHEHSVDPASEFASDAASSSSLPPQPHRDRAPSPTPKPKRSQYASLETSDESERAESASSSVAGPPSPSASSSRFSSSSAAAAAGSHSPTDRLADVPLQSPIKVSLRQHAEEDDDLPEL